MIDETTETPQTAEEAGRPSHNDFMRQLQDEDRFLNKMQLAATAARRTNLRLRIIPNVYDNTKRTYKSWPGRAWSLDVASTHDAKDLLHLFDLMLLCYDEVGYARMRETLELVVDKKVE